MTIGFIGTGAIAGAMVTGLSSEGGPRPEIRVSPRNAETAAGLAKRFENVRVGASNQEVVDASETVVLAVRPQIGDEVVSQLRFSEGQAVISLIPGFLVLRLAGMVRPAHRIWRAIPLPFVAGRRGPIAIHPPGGAAEELFAQLGEVFGIEKEDRLNLCSTATSTMAAYFGFVGRIASWMSQNGAPEEQARGYVAQMFAGLAEAGVEGDKRGFEELARAFATPGGLNEQVSRELTERGALDMLTDALDRVHRRASGQLVLRD